MYIDIEHSVNMVLYKCCLYNFIIIIASSQETDRLGASDARLRRLDSSRHSGGGEVLVPSAAA